MNVSNYVGNWNSLPQTRARKATTCVAALALFASTFALALVLDHPRPGILHFHVVPIAILALVLGIVAGLSAIAFSLSLMAVWAELEGVELLMIDYMSGAVPLLLVVLLCQFVAVRAFGQNGSAKPGPLVDRLRSNSAKELTNREKEVLGLLALGYTNKQVAEELVLSVRTVESHRARIQQKLGISGRAELVRYASGCDLLSELAAAPSASALGQVQ
jgi:DNA-binding CsgD family transcriptional regulator